MELRESARAKINLFLEITGRRPDGYHLLETVFQEVSLSDDLEIRPAKTFSLQVSDPSLPHDQRNLALRAALLLARRIPRKVIPVRIRLLKRIPVGGGLGGGSSDAAAVLRGLCRLWRIPLTSALVGDTAKELGADVPFFIRGGTALGRGIGDRLTPLPTPRFWAVIVHPGHSVATPWAYRQIRLPLTHRYKVHKITEALVRRVPADDWAGRVFNRFEEVVLPVYPRILSALRALRFYGCRSVLLSGSGSCVFGISGNEEMARKVHRRIRRDGWDSWVVRSSLR